MFIMIQLMTIVLRPHTLQRFRLEDMLSTVGYTMRTHAAPTKGLLNTYVEHMTITHERSLWMTQSGRCLIESVEKNAHNHKRIRVSMFRLGTASKEDSLTRQAVCETFPSLSNTVEFVHVRSQID